MTNPEELESLMKRHNLVLDIAHAVKVDDEEKAIILLDTYITTEVTAALTSFSTDLKDELSASIKLFQVS